MKKEIKYDITDNIRIDKYLCEMDSDLSRSKISSLIKSSKIVVNNETITKPSYKLKGIGVILIDVELKEDYELSEWNECNLLNIIDETEDYIIINKPENMSVHPGAKNRDKTLVNLLIGCKKELDFTNSLDRPGIVHRLDKDTTGLLIISKNNKFTQHITKQFKEHLVEKKYIAIVDGIIPSINGKIDAPIGRDQKNRLKMTVTERNSKDAVTEFSTLKSNTKNNMSLVEFRIITGRTHQIRVHSNYVGVSIHNDAMYGTLVDNQHGLLLHSGYLKFKNLDGKEVEYKIEPPIYFKELISRYNLI